MEHALVEGYRKRNTLVIFVTKQDKTEWKDERVRRKIEQLQVITLQPISTDGELQSCII